MLLCWRGQVFARGLVEAGYRDRAAAVYCNLLQAGPDKAQQVWRTITPFCVWALTDGQLVSALGGCGTKSARGHSV